MLNDNKSKIVYDLEERTSAFSENILIFCKEIKITIFNENIIKQLIKSSTSIGANYMEANGASSKKDFCNKIFICKKEAQETRYWLRLLAKINFNNKETIAKLKQEAQELAMIFNKIASKTKST